MEILRTILTLSALGMLYFPIILFINLISHYIYRKLGLKVPTLIINKVGDKKEGDTRYEIEKIFSVRFNINVYEAYLIKQPITGYIFIPLIPINVYHLVEKKIYSFLIEKETFDSFKGDKEKFNMYVDGLIIKEEMKKQKEENIDYIISKLNN